jgi:tripartite-type tricarboxylate transporter receptor subunit TctC
VPILTKRVMLVAAVLAGLASSAAIAEDYPTKPIRIIVGFTAGSAGDVLARVVAGDMSKRLGQTIIVEDKPGASSNIAAEYVARAPKDGYTLLLGTVANATNAAVMTDLHVDFVKDFTPIGMAAILPVLFVVHPSLNVKTVPEFIALAKSKRPPAVTDLIAGRTQAMFASASTVLPLVKSGALVALATAAPKRTDSAPDLPTMAELGMPSLDASIWFGLMTPAGVAPEINAKLAKALAETMKSEEVLATLKRSGFDPLTGTPDEFAKYIQVEIKKWSAVATAAGVRH